MKPDQDISIFDRLPGGIFRPLASPINRRYWFVLSKLLGGLWGEEEGSAPGMEYAKAVVVREIETALVQSDDLGEDALTPLGTQAHSTYGQLLDAGWLSTRRRGLVDMVTVKPKVSMFFHTLRDFASQEPEYIGGQVRSIKLNLETILQLTNDADGPSAYRAAAKQARQCMLHIINTGCRIQDLMDHLVELDSPKAFVEGFFTDFVEQVFIADYSQLRTRDHPLMYRDAILQIQTKIQLDEQCRQWVVDWYIQKVGNGDEQKGIKAFLDDSNKIYGLRRIEDHLARLDDEISTANQRALTLLEYKLRAPRALDRLVAKAIAGLEQLDEDHHALPAKSHFPHWSPDAIPKPRKVVREQEATSDVDRTFTPHELAIELLRQRMLENRKITSITLAAYMAKVLGNRKSITSDEISIDSINDLCCYQRLLLLATRSEAPASIRRNDTMLAAVRGVRVSFVGEEQTENHYMAHRKFAIERGLG